MITNKRSVRDTKDLCASLRAQFDIPVSLLISPTILSVDDFEDFRLAGADKIGVAIDCATEDLFDRFRGKQVGGPHQWKRYWDYLGECIRIFGYGNGGAHFMVGMGETEREMCDAIQRVRDMEGRTHLFSFFPEVNSQMANYPVPPMDKYRRIQVARYLIDNRIGRIDRFIFNEGEEIEDFGLSSHDLDRIINSGNPFRTSGCEGKDGEVACNRPFANSRPGPDMRNYPFPPNDNDIIRIRGQMGISGNLKDPELEAHTI
jgi:biotin synthase